MSIKNDKSLILSKIKSHYNFKKDADFARFLKIAPQTLSSWYYRNTFDIDILYSKCVGVSADFLITGKGVVFKEEEIKDIVPDRELELLRELHDKNKKNRTIRAREYFTKNKTKIYRIKKECKSCNGNTQ